MLPKLITDIARWYQDPQSDPGGMWMEGVQFVTDDKRQKVAVLIDLRKYGELSEGIYDSLTAGRRARKPRESLNSVKKRLRKRAKLNA